MPTITFRQSMTTATTFNALRDSIYETLTGPALVRIGLHSNVNLVVVSISSGPDILAEEGPVPFSAAEAVPIDPDEFQWEDEAAAGDKLKIFLRNNNAGTAIVNGVVKIDWL